MKNGLLSQFVWFEIIMFCFLLFVSLCITSTGTLGRVCDRGGRGGAHAEKATM